MLHKKPQLPSQKTMLILFVVLLYINLNCPKRLKNYANSNFSGGCKKVVPFPRKKSCTYIQAFKDNRGNPATTTILAGLPKKSLL